MRAAVVSGRLPLLGLQTTNECWPPPPASRWPLVPLNTHSHSAAGLVDASLRAMGGTAGGAKLALLSAAGVLLLPTVAAQESGEWRSDVLALTDSNIEAAIQSTDVLMVEFYGALSHSACSGCRRSYRCCCPAAPALTAAAAAARVRVSFCTNGWDAQARRLRVETGCAAQGAWQAGGRVRCACLRCGALTGSDAQRACGRLRCAFRLEAARRTATATEQRLVRVCAGASASLSVLAETLAKLFGHCSVTGPGALGLVQRSTWPPR